jgi:hypothetical protein
MSQILFARSSLLYLSNGKLFQIEHSYVESLAAVSFMKHITVIFVMGCVTSSDL